MDNREDRHGNSQAWNHASTSGQPSLRPLNDSSLKPLSPLRAMPAAQPPQPPAHTTGTQPAPMPAWQPAARPQGQPQAAPVPAWQPDARTPMPPQAAPNPAMQPMNRPQMPGQPAATPAWQPAAPAPMPPQAAPNPAMQPMNRPQMPGQPAATPAWQPDARTQMPPQAAPNPAMQPITRPQIPGQPAATPAWQPDARKQMPPQAAPNPAMQPMTRPQMPGQPATTPAWQPDARTQAPPQAAPNPAMQSMNRPQMPGQPAAVPAWRYDTRAQGQPAPIPAPGNDAPPLRRVWTQTMPQQAPQAQTPPHASPADTVPVAAFVPRKAPEPTLVRRERQPDAPAATGATGETMRRRRILAHLDRAPGVDTGADSMQDTPEDEDDLPYSAFDAFEQAQAASPQPPAFEAGVQSPAATSADRADDTGAQPYPMDFTPSAVPAWQPAASVPVRDAPDLLDDDSGRFEAVSNTRLAEPVPVPTFGTFTPAPSAKHRRRHALRTTLIVLLALGAVAFALYQSGLGAQLWQSVFPAATNGGSVPSVFGQAPSDGAKAAGTIAPATQVTAPELRSAKVDPASAKAPAQLTFQLETNAATTAILLLTETNATLHTTAYGTPQGDGLLWQVTADMQEPYTGKVRVFLRDGLGTWSEGNITCAVDVQ